MAPGAEPGGPDLGGAAPSTPAPGGAQPALWQIKG
jgi:hypothetical protein